MKNTLILLICFIHILVLPVYTQLAVDTLLFKISLFNDASTQSLFNINNARTIRGALSGPVVMKDNTLLFYSKNGYILYNQTGSIVDSHSVFKSNSGLSRNDPERIKLALPLNNNTLLFYRDIPRNGYSLTIFEKKLYRRLVNPCKESGYPYCKDIKNKHIYNIAFNTVTDDMRESYCIEPRLVGFTSFGSGDKWWSVDKMYSFSSPIVIEDEKGTYKSFFPGINSKKDRNTISTIEPLQIFTRDGRLYYSGIASKINTKSEQCFQTYFVFDQAGNKLYADRLLKRDNIDAIIGEDEETYYTMRKVKRDVFQPTVNSTGDVFYGIFDCKKKRIEVRKRVYYQYEAISSQPALDKIITNEKCLEFVPVALSGKMKSAGNMVLPKVTLVDPETNKFVRAEESHLSQGGYVCYISRTPNREIKKRLARGKSGVPKSIRGIIGKLTKESTVLCPYSISLLGPKGVVRKFHYPAGDEIVCARVMAKYNRDELLVRVDCKKYAEALIFKTDGTFVNRFIFNRQNYEERLDIIAVSEGSPIIELDYETVPESHTYLKWVKTLTE